MEHAPEMLQFEYWKPFTGNTTNYNEKPVQTVWRGFFHNILKFL